MARVRCERQARGADPAPRKSRMACITRPGPVVVVAVSKLVMISGTGMEGDYSTPYCLASHRIASSNRACGASA